MFDVITFGSAIVDVFLKSSHIFKRDKEKINIDERVICAGGGGTNTAVSFVRLGLNCAAVVRLGDDLFGQLIVEELEQEKVNINFLVQKNEETDSSVILIGPNGKRIILIYRGPTRLEDKNINWDKLNAKWFYLASLEGNLDLAEKLISFANKKNIKVAWNPGKKELTRSSRVFQLANNVELFNLNREEMEELIGEKFRDKQFWEKVKKVGAKLTIVTDGRSGAYLLNEKKLLFKSTPKTIPIDETGAGDAFGSGFVAGLIKGMSLESAFDLAMKNGASVVQKIGAKAGLLKISN